MQCMTMEVKPRIMKQFVLLHLLKLQGKVMKDGKKVSLHDFWQTRRSCVCGKKCMLGHPIA